MNSVSVCGLSLLFFFFSERSELHAWMYICFYFAQICLNVIIKLQTVSLTFTNKLIEKKCNVISNVRLANFNKMNSSGSGFSLVFFFFSRGDRHTK